MWFWRVQPGQYLAAFLLFMLVTADQALTPFGAAGGSDIP
jgi:hypothetical protein